MNMGISALSRPTGTPHEALNRLKAVLLDLPDSGDNGFEGLVGALLGSVTHVSFRLAASGSQDGQDGRGDGPMGAISFEAKLYRSKLTKSVVNNKATDIIASAGPPDLWVLAATNGLTTQIATTLRSAFARTETSLLVLDWPTNSPLPPLALVCAMEPEVLPDFLAAHWPQAVGRDEVQADLAALTALPDFEARSAALRAELNTPMLGAPIALSANRTNFVTLFAKREKAMHRFGQPLAPAATFALTTVERQSRASLDAVFAEPPGGELIVVTGDQGSGKSWAVAQAWLAQAVPPFLLFLTSAEAAAVQDVSIPSLIATGLIEQAGDVVTDEASRRWLRRLHQWAHVPAISSRLVVVIDGLNERARTDWAPWLSKLTSYVSSIGGRVIATSRARYFKRIENRLTIPFRSIQVGDFSNAELNAALASHGISPNQIAQRVRPSLRNPRILGIALDLLSSAEIRTAEELSIERLLFEHIRTHQSDPGLGETPYQFSRLLSSHASEVRDRIIGQVSDDQLVFYSYDFKDAPKYDLPRDLLPVVEERFFEALDEDPSLYQLTDDGLVYGLALATIRELQAAERNNRSVVERLADIVEPVAALDKVTDVLFAAALLASVDDQVSRNIGAALLERHAAQQNVDEDSYPAFSGIVRNMPAAALDALFVLDTTDRHAQHKDWLVAALRSARENADAWSMIAARLDGWLRLCSLNPAHSMPPGEDDADKRAKALEETSIKIAAKLDSLTLYEQAFLDEKIVRNDVIKSHALGEDTFLILAGMPLEPFAEALVCWAFARALNSSYRAPWRDYSFVVQHNRCDWFETRAALLKASECFAQDDASRAASWALVYVLRATGNADDGDRAEALAETLIEDWQRFEGWRLVERYCPTDPCDPASGRPEEISATAERYSALVPSDLMVNRWVGEHEHFFQDASPGIARFEPEVGAALSRSFLENLLTRPSSIALFALNWLDRGGVLLTSDTVDRALERVAELSHPEKPTTGDGDKDWVVSQYLLVAALAHLEGDAQARTLRDLPEHGPPLLQLDHVFRPASIETVNALLDQAIQSKEEHRLLMALAFVRSSNSTLSGTAISRIRQLTDHPQQSVRGLAMQISAEHPDEAQLKAFVASGWSATSLDSHEDFYERWHGSSLIIVAAERNLLTAAEAVARIIPERYSDAAKCLGRSAVGAPLANLLTHAVGRVLETTMPFRPPRVSQQDEGNADSIARFSLEHDEDDLALDQKMNRINESDEDFSARQRAGWDRFQAFANELTKSGAELILRDIGFEAVAAAAEQDPTFLNEVAQQILALPRARIPRVANLASRIARALAIGDPVAAVSVFRACRGKEGYVRITCTQAGIPLMAWDAWHCHRSATIEEYWQERLEGATSDHDLSIEVLSACFAGRQDFLEGYAQTAIASGHPVLSARALMILGFCDESKVAESEIERFQVRNGLVGQAADAAKFAYERSSWSRAWYERLLQTGDPVDFWRFATLLGKIADPRVLLWSAAPNVGGLLERFGWSLEKPLGRRLEKWKQKRSKKLFGGDRPREIYLPVLRRGGFEGLE
jgi:hypothetical protein